MSQAELFDGQHGVDQRAQKKKRTSSGWEFTDHACKHCMGRIMRRVNPGGAVVVRCAECGASVVGEHEALCWCGVEVRRHGNVFECYRNPDTSIGVPQEILVREKPLVKAERRGEPRKSKPVRVDGYENL